MSTPIIAKELAILMFNSNIPELKEAALKDYPELSMKITARLKTFEDCYNEVKKKFPNDIPELVQVIMSISKTSDHVPKSMRVFIICEAFKENWIPNWDDSNERKYSIYFSLSSSGSGFSYSGCNYDYAYSPVGSRLVYIDHETAEYVGRTFTKEYSYYLK